jgi:hypothetical protein
LQLSRGLKVSSAIFIEVLLVFVTCRPFVCSSFPLFSNIVACCSWTCWLDLQDIVCVLKRSYSFKILYLSELLCWCGHTVTCEVVFTVSVGFATKCIWKEWFTVRLLWTNKYFCTFSTQSLSLIFDSQIFVCISLLRYLCYIASVSFFLI